MSFTYLYFQLTILIVFSALVAGRIVYLRHRYKINAISIIRNKGVQRILGITVVTIINVWVAITLIYILHPEIAFLPYPLNVVLVNSAPVKILGISLILLGLIMYIKSWVVLSNAWRIGHDHEHSSDLITKGIYGFSRNPMYLFYDLYFVGTFLINGALVFLILSFLLIVNLHYLIIQEEKYLNMTHGESFKAYSRRTSRYLTWSRSLHVKKVRNRELQLE